MKADQSPINTATMTPVEQIASADIEFRDEVAELSERAREYVGSFLWCKDIVRGWLDFACGYVIGIFYFNIVPAKLDVPHFVWIIVGDIPPAYMDGEFHQTSGEALDAYVNEMQEWVNRVIEGRPLDDDVIPVNVPPEKQWAEKLQSRLNKIRELFLDESRDTA